MLPLDILVVGVGRWGKRHLAALKELQRKGLVDGLFAYDIDESRRKVVEDTGAIWAPNLKKRGMAAVVATTTESHYRVARNLIEAGMHVLIEKPMAQTTEDAHGLMDAALAKGTIIETGLLLRHHPAVKRARLLIAEGAIGNIERIHCTRLSTRPCRENESIIDVLAIHYLDLCCHFLHEAEPMTTQAQIDTTPKSMRCRISLGFHPGIEGLCDVEWGASEEVRKMEIIGTEDRIELDFANHSSLLLGEQKIILKDQIPPLTAELITFLERCSNMGEQPTTTGRPALRSVGWKDRLSIIDAGLPSLQQH